ncbi:hypothetical protein BJX62DRAFT_243017 [Aspergillus germanicus]
MASRRTLCPKARNNTVFTMPIPVKSDHGPISHKITVPAHWMLIFEADDPQSKEDNWVRYYHTRVDHGTGTCSLASSDPADEYNRRLWLTSKERVARIPFDKKELVERLARAVAPQRCETELNIKKYSTKRGASGYELSIEDGPMLYILEPSLTHWEKLASLTKQECTDFRDQAQIIEPKSCQEFVLYMLRYLAGKGLIEEEVVEHYRQRLQKSVLAQMRERQRELPSAPVLASMFRGCEEYAQKCGLNPLHFDTCLE